MRSGCKARWLALHLSGGGGGLGGGEGGGGRACSMSVPVTPSKESTI